MCCQSCHKCSCTLILTCMSPLSLFSVIFSLIGTVWGLGPVCLVGFGGFLFAWFCFLKIWENVLFVSVKQKYTLTKDIWIPLFQTEYTRQQVPKVFPHWGWPYWLRSYLAGYHSYTKNSAHWEQTESNCFWQQRLVNRKYLLILVFRAIRTPNLQNWTQGENIHIYESIYIYIYV